MRRSFALAFVFLFFIISACLSSPAVLTPIGPTVTYNPFATLSPTPFLPQPATDTSLSPPTLTIWPTVTSTPLPGTRPRYNIQAMLDYAGHSLSVDEYIFYQNSTGVVLDNMVLAVEPNYWQGCFTLGTLSGQGVAGYSLEANRLEVEFNPPLAPGDSVNLYIHYSLALPPADRQHIFGYKNGQIILVDWYPFVVPYINGWVLHAPGEVGEHLFYDAADFDVTLAWSDLSSPLTIAAGAPVANGNFRLNGARTAAVSVSDRLVQSSSTSINGVTVASYYFPEEEVQGERLLEEVSQAVSFYSEHFGSYPYPSLSIVETDYYDGMEYDGIFFLSRSFYLYDDGTKLNYLVDIAVHETAHQWWFGLVGNDQALDPWLDETLATYSEYLFYEQYYPGVADAWWQFRVEAFSPAGYVDSTIYASDDFQTYANAVYLRGAQFMRDLRARIGDEAFFAFLKDYVAQMNGKISAVEDFFRVLGYHTGADVSDLMDEYFSP
ncbi:MAG: M1 family metallopeptidase [Chloroflexi bacterium]|nr:M1 family metallopeptidase [Chloroflexota bacterium]